MDKRLEQRGHQSVFYADDCNISVRSKRSGTRVMQHVVTLYAKLKLRITVEKSAVARARERPFLGYRFGYAPGGHVKRRVAPKAMAKLKERLREITSSRVRRCTEYFAGGAYPGTRLVPQRRTANAGGRSRHMERSTWLFQERTFSH